MYKHFVITRFNINFGLKDKLGRNTLTEDWMIDRFSLFENYCLPSLINQSVNNFEWLVLFDMNTPMKFRERIDTYKSQIPFFIPVFLDRPDNMDIKDAVIDAINCRLSTNDDYVITTRIDNDDAIHKDFLFEVQRLFNFQQDCFIEFHHGYQWNVHNCVLSFLYAKSGHFPSRIEKIENGVKTVMSVTHTKIVEVENIIDVNDPQKRLWIEVVHDTNVINDYRVLLPQFNNSVIIDFNLDLQVNEKNRICMLLNYIIRAFLLKTRLFPIYERVNKIVRQ